jgi:glycosyltransferase involved in cell wall biosynthesis
LLRAYARLIKDCPGLSYQLVIVGGKGWKNSDVYKEYRLLRLKDAQVKFLGYVSSKGKDMINLYSNTGVFVFPSFYEGFGLPPLEAMACGVPVVVSDIPVFREILGEAALFSDPHKPEEIANAIYRILTDTRLAESLRHKGRERAGLFSWERAAQDTLGVFNKQT